MATEDSRKLFVAGLPESISEEVLRQLFEATGGKVVEVSLPRDRATGKIRGFGFVTFATADEASAARDSLDGSFQAGRSISVRPFSSEPPKRGERMERGPGMESGGPRSDAPGPPQPSEDRTLYVGNLPYDATQQEVSTLLTDNGVGPIVRIHLPVGPDGRMRGFGFVTLATAESANHAATALRDVQVRGRRLMVNIAHPRGAGPPGAGPAGFSDRPRGPRPEGSWGGEPRFPTEPPMNFEGARPPRREGGPPEAEGSEEAKRKNKKKANATPAKSEKRTAESRRRGGGSNWQSLRDPDDED